jgi:hypothetical protein
LDRSYAWGRNVEYRDQAHWLVVAGGRIGRLQLVERLELPLLLRPVQRRSSLVNNPCQCASASFCRPGENGCSETGPDGVTKQVPCACGGNCGHGYFCHTAKDSCLDDSDCAGGICTFDLTGQAWICVTVCIGPV